MNPAAMIALGAGAGSAAGGMLGQVADTFSLPRRQLWQFLGAPEYGNQLVAGLTGMDPSNPWAQALGFGAEVLGDPLTYAGLGLGGLLGGAEAGAAATRAGLEGTIAAQTAAREAAAGALASHQDELARILAQQQARFTDLGQIVDTPGMAQGLSRTFSTNMDPMAALQMQKWGLGELANTGNLGEFTLQGQKLPAMYAMGGPLGPQMRTDLAALTNLAGGPTAATVPEMQALSGELSAMGGPIVKQMNRFPWPAEFAAPAVGPNPRELFHIMKQIAGREPGLATAPGFAQDVLGGAAQGMAAELSPQMPMMGGVAADVAAGQSHNHLQLALQQLAGFDEARAMDPLLRQGMIGAGLGTGMMLGANAAQPRGQRFF